MMSAKKEKRSRSRDRRHRKERKRSIFGSESSERKHKKSHRHHSRKQREESPDRSRPRRFEEKSRKVERSPSNESSSQSVKEKPCFIPSGILAKYSNTVNGVELKFTEPLDSCLPETLWQIFPFKGSEEFDTLNLDFKSCFLFGKDLRVVDFRLDNPSCSSQHAVIQFRNITVQLEDGTYRSETRPYLMDLNSTNGTQLNGAKIEPQKYYQLLPKDVLKFGLSQREYVVMHNESETLDHNRHANVKR